MDEFPVDPVVEPVAEPVVEGADPVERVEAPTLEAAISMTTENLEKVFPPVLKCPTCGRDATPGMVLNETPEIGKCGCGRDLCGER